MGKLIATSIKTKDQYSIIESLKKNDWKVITENYQFNKGIDFDFYELAMNWEKIVFAWDNWFKREIKYTEQRIQKGHSVFNSNSENQNIYLLI